MNQRTRTLSESSDEESETIHAYGTSQKHKFMYSNHRSSVEDENETHGYASFSTRERVPSNSHSSDEEECEIVQDYSPVAKRQRITSNIVSSGEEESENVHEYAPIYERQMFSRNRSSCEEESEGTHMYSYSQKRHRVLSNNRSSGEEESEPIQGYSPAFKKQRFISSRTNRSSSSCTGEDDHGNTDATEDGEGISDNLEIPSSSIQTTESESNPKFHSNVQRMMKVMGYKEGRGLGKKEQGIVNPIEHSKQRGRRGLGLVIAGLEAATNLTWDSTKEVIEVEEDYTWLTNKDESMSPLTLEVLEDWMKIGNVKLTIDDEFQFCDPVILQNILKSKSVFDELDPEELKKARTRSNPFELIKNGIFLNRAAMKMANMDKVFDMMFTNPKDIYGNYILGPMDLLYFADVCAGPGGFSEYVFYRKKWRAKGFGFTLKGQHDFRLSDFFAGPCETFYPHYGYNEPDREADGDIFNPANIAAFAQFVLDNTDGLGVHFMMADGGFSVDGQENIQEILSKQLYLCQFLVALKIVRTGGHFVCKIFDLFTPFSVGLIYLMYKSFHSICIHKPNSSRPANSERYLICKYKRDDCDEITHHLFNINLKLQSYKSVAAQVQKDVTQLVPLEVITDDEDFYKYIVNSNNSLGERQIVGLMKIATFCRDDQLVEGSQDQLKIDCLKYWDVRNTVRRAPDITKPQETVRKILMGSEIELVTSDGKTLDTSCFESSFKSIYDWHFCTSGSSFVNEDDCGFFVGLGKSRVYRWKKSQWIKVEDIELSPNTLVYGEIIYEFRSEGKSQMKNSCFHIIDAISLGGEDISKLHITKRLEWCHMFAKALNKPNNLVRAKVLYELENIQYFFSSLCVKSQKSKGKCRAIVLEGESFYVPQGLIFFNGTEVPWRKHYSKSKCCKYYFNACTGESKYEKDRPDEACTTFTSSFTKRIIWKWSDQDRKEQWNAVEAPNGLSAALIRFVDKNCVKM